MNDFFGDLSTLQIIVLVLGVFGGFFAIARVIIDSYRYFWGSAKIVLTLSDKVDLVIGSDGKISDFHIACSLENQGTKTGTIQRIDACIRNPNEEECCFRWEEFYGYASGNERIKESDPHAVAVRKHETEFVQVVFRKPKNACESFNWIEGRYDFDLFMWVNAKKLDDKNKIKIQFRAFVPDHLSEWLIPRSQPKYFRIDIIEWFVLD